MVDPRGKLSQHEGQRFHWMAIDESDQPFGARLPSIPGGEINAVGRNPTLLLSSDVPLVIGRDGALYYPEFADGTVKMMRFTRSGERSVFATLPPKATGGPVRWINGLALGPDGSLYYTEDVTIRKIDVRGVVFTVATNMTVANCAQIPGVEEAAPYLRGLSVARDGTIFVAAAGCGAVLKITPRGAITTVLQTTSPWSPTAVAMSPSGLYVQEYLHTANEDRLAWVPRIRKVLANGTIANIATVERTKAP